MKLLIKNGRLIDPANKKDGLFDLLVVKNKIAKIGPDLDDKVDHLIDAKGLVVTPGFVDLHTHLREPGFEHKETIESGAESAAAGGFTTLVCMANTNPVHDNPALTKWVLKRIKSTAKVHVFPVGSVTKDLKGERLSDLEGMAKAGVVAFSDDGNTVMDTALLEKAMKIARRLKLPILSHAEDLTLTAPGSMNEGVVSTELGLEGSPALAEEKMVARDIELCRKTGARLHIQHISTGGALKLVTTARRKGLPVTCEVMPHHFSLTEEAVRGFDTRAKMRPPLRLDSDIKILKQGLKNGLIQAIATDHAPHASHEKETPFSCAANGLVGLETALPLCLKLVEEGVLSLSQLIKLLTIGPANVLDLPKGSLSVGATADIVIFDPNKKIIIEAKKLKSKSKNTPFDGWKLKGLICYTLVAGKVVYQCHE